MKKLTVINMVVLAVVAYLFYNIESVIDVIDDYQQMAAILVIVAIGAIIRFVGVWAATHKVVVDGLPKVSVTEKSPESVNTTIVSE